jgi:hypothetical protein
MDHGDGYRLPKGREDSGDNYQFPGNVAEERGYLFAASVDCYLVSGGGFDGRDGFLDHSTWTVTKFTSCARDVIDSYLVG